MKTIVSLLLLSGAVMCQRIAVNTTRITSYGTWGEKEHCPEGKFATGLSIKYQKRNGRSDITALNGIRLLCNSPNGKRSENTAITSSVGGKGDWQPVEWCPAGLVVIGYALYDQKYTATGDNAGVVNYAAYCGYAHGPRNVAKWVQGNSESLKGTLRWQENRFCPTGYAVCGVQSSIDENEKSRDRQGLTNANADCCKVSEEEITCENPTIQTSKLAYFDNVQAGKVSVTYNVKHSFSYVHTNPTPNSVEVNKIKPKMLAAAAQLAKSYNAAVGKGKAQATEATISAWINDAVSNPTEKTHSVEVAVSKNVEIKQYTIVCGAFKVNLPTVV